MYVNWASFFRFDRYKYEVLRRAQHGWIILESLISLLSVNRAICWYCLPIPSDNQLWIKCNLLLCRRDWEKSFTLQPRRAYWLLYWRIRLTAKQLQLLFVFFFFLGGAKCEFYRQYRWIIHNHFCFSCFCLRALIFRLIVSWGTLLRCNCLTDPSFFRLDFESFFLSPPNWREIILYGLPSPTYAVHLCSTL